MYAAYAHDQNWVCNDLGAIKVIVSFYGVPTVVFEGKFQKTQQKDLKNTF